MLRLVAGEPGTYEVTLTCAGPPGCSVRDAAEVLVQRFPVFSVAAVEDPSACSAGLRLTWEEATFQLGPGRGSYAIYRSEDPTSPTCEDALSRAPIASGLRGLSWVDLDPGSVPRAYVVEAEDLVAPTACAPTGPSHGGAVRHACVGPVTDAGSAPFPDGIYAALRASRAGDVVTLDWTRARALLPGEHVHVRKAWRHPATAWTRVNPEGDVGRTHAETDLSARLQFFDVRAANACEDESRAEYGILP